VRRSTICFIAVGTPEGANGEADLSAVLAVAERIGEAMDGYRVIVDKSTVPVGTAERVAEIIRRRTAHAFDVVSNPEFLKEGTAIEDFQKPDRVVIGHRGERARAIMEELYKPFVRTGNPILFMSPESAEMTKYAANAMLAARISLINEIANLCEAVGSDVEDVRRGVGLDRRIGPAFLFPGVGYGGSCFPKDVKALIRSAAHVGHSAELLRSVENVNERQKSVLVGKLRTYFDDQLADRSFALWGLAFKPNTDDMREAPSRVIIDALLEAGARVRAYDPVASNETRRLYGAHPKSGMLTFCKDAYEAAAGADALLIATEWKEFRSPDYDRLKTLLKTPLIFDGRNLYDPGFMSRLGIQYFAIGRGAQVPRAARVANLKAGNSQ